MEKTIRIAVIDDERPARSELKHQLMRILPDAVIEEGDSGAAALEMAGEKEYDLFFLDINLGDISGTALVKVIKKLQPDAKIVFVTAYSEYAVQAFELEVQDYVMKPFEPARIEKVLKRCLGSESEKNQHLLENEVSAPKRLAINDNGKIIFEEPENIVYIETYNRGCRIFTVDHQYFEGKPIGEYEKKLENLQFFRIHKSYLVNIEKVKEIFPWGKNSFSLKMKGYEDSILPIARDKTKTLRQILEG